ncbi:hypothetical protein [Methanohalophilus sp.]|uniref:DUF7557 family protein n=1 Tax=Methanohalophilus sp. TaxID=1966352 RepID=UPI00260F80E4|nr:hypothetical protein [Methanohalophilus sp.]MDK2892841.1 hypothetical protein [Methanohalophilus sp.]
MNAEATTIPITKSIRDRLKSFGQKGETYSDILTRMMDSIDRDEFMDRMYRRLEEKDQFVSLDSYESELNGVQN